MKSEDRSRLSTGLILILIGVFFLAYRMVPGLRELMNLRFSWPFLISGFGIALLLIGTLSNEPDMAMPAMFFFGLGGLLYWQNATGNWGSWAYAWTLFPGFVGVGQLLSWVLGSRKPNVIADGLRTILTSAVLFLIFGSFLGNFNLLGIYWPVLLIALGLIILVKPLFLKKFS